MLRISIVTLLLTVFAAPVWAGAEGEIHVIDGDTLQVGTVRIRLQGIDAPETNQDCRTEHGQPWHCGAWVKQAARTRYEGKRAVCTDLGTDRYGRMIATCEVEGQDIGARFVEDGLAFAYRKYSTRYVAFEPDAKRRDVGLWAMQVQNPAQFRRVQADAKGTQQKPVDSSCNIKGNISAKGVRIYHVPGQKYYSKTRISPNKGERWFCSETEARRAGWRKSKI